MQLKDKILKYSRDAFYTITSLVTGAVPGLSQEEETPEPKEPEVAQYFQPGEALPEFGTHMRLYGGPFTGDHTGNTAVGNARIEASGYSVAGTHFSQNHEFKDSETFGIPSTGNFSAEDRKLETERNGNWASVRAGNFSAQASQTDLEQNDTLRNFSSNTGGGSTSTFLDDFKGNRTLDTSSGAVTYRFPTFKMALFGFDQKDKRSQRDFTELTDSLSGFNATIEDIIGSEVRRRGLGASAAFIVLDGLQLGLDAVYGKTSIEQSARHVEIQNGTVTVNNNSRTDDDYNPMIARVTSQYAPRNSPFSASAGVGGVSDRLMKSKNGKSGSQFIADGAVLMRLGDNFGVYALAGIDPEGETYFLPAITFASSEHNQKMHNLGQFAAGQRLYFGDEAVDTFTFQNRIHGMAYNGWVIGALFTTDYTINGDEKHARPFIAGNIGGEGSGVNNIISLSGNIVSDRGTTVKLLNSFNVDLGNAGILEFLLGGNAILDKKTTNMPKSQSFGYFVGLGYNKILN